MKNKKPQNKNSFNQYWIYGGIIFIFLLINLFSGSAGYQDTISTTPSKFFEFVKEGDVEKIEIINAINKAKSSKFIKSLEKSKNPYGDGGASTKIVKVLKKMKIKNLINKKFYDI